MCGIYGINKPLQSNIVSSKLSCIAHRGPDFTSHNIIDNRLTFGHNRLAIIDLEQRSNQPFHTEGYWIVFNGEIFNYLQIKTSLVRAGFSFNTTSDTEVLLNAYRHYGKECVKHLNGMFAFVIYDPVQNIFFGARDRLGQKPFYYYLRDNEFEFASQLQQISINRVLTINEQAKGLYFRFGYIPDPLTIFNKVYKLEAGFQFTYTLKGNYFQKEQYWDLMHETPNSDSTFNYFKSELSATLKDAVALRLQADVNVGVFLSGGIDSSLIAALASQCSSTKIKTFSIKFSESTFDESEYARKVASLLNTDHTEIECSEKELLLMAEKFVDFYDEPFTDTSALPMMLLSKYTRKQVTVALSGDAGDELFWGYQRYFNLKKVAPLYKVLYLRKSASILARYLPGYKLKLIAEGLEKASLEELYLFSISNFDVNKLFNSPISATLPEFYDKYLFSEKHIFEQVADFDIKTYLSGDINTKVDRASMAFSLEARSPLMDYRVVELSQRIPLKFKYHDHKGKHIIREVLYDYLPKNLFERKKQGFTVPMKVWFRKELKDMVYDTLKPENLTLIGDVNVSYVNQLIESHMKQKANNYYKIWALMVYILWFKKYCEG